MATSDIGWPGTGDASTQIQRITNTSDVFSLALRFLASLRLTVVLFALAIFLVFAGTLAQKDHGIWYVVDFAYFRVWLARIEWRTLERLVQMFYPVDWKLGGFIYYPGGKLIGLLLMANLLAAHAVRFKIAAEGRRLAVGLGIIGLGIIATYLVIRSGMNDAVESELSPYFCHVLWHSLRAALGFVALAGAYLLVLSYGRMRMAEWSLLTTIDAIAIAVVAWSFLHPEARLDDSGLRILWQLVKGSNAGLILLVGCLLVFRQRAGIVLLHGGVALMMLGELLTGLSAQEARMSIDEGQTTNFARDIRTAELAVVDQADADHDVVTVVPESLLKQNVGAAAPLDGAGLPFTIRVHRWLPNSNLAEVPAGQTSPATTGVGRRMLAHQLPQATGVDNDAGVDTPSAYVELFSKPEGQSLGTYLVSQLLRPQPVEVDGDTYELALRFKRIYYPYTLTLKDFRFDRYAGTNVAKNYSSLVQLRDPAQNVDREVLIWMNNPLRYAGTTFYQSGFDPSTEQATVLQVVSNAGWMIPYVACMLVAYGMLAHFGLALSRFSRRRVKEAARRDERRTSDELRLTRRTGTGAQLAKWFPAVVLILCAGYVAGKMRMPESPASEMQVYEFAELPLVFQGRVKPYDTLARNSLQVLSGRQQVVVERADGKKGKLPAIRWLLDAISGSRAGSAHRVFRIENLDLLQTLGLEPREGSFRYSLDDLRGKFEELDKQIRLANAQPEAQRSLYQRKVLELASKINFYILLTKSFQSPQIRSDRELFVQDMQTALQEIEQLRASSAPHPVPPTTATGRWTTLMEAEWQLVQDRVKEQPVNPATVALRGLLSAYAAGDPTKFNKQLTDYRRILSSYEKSLNASADQLREAGVAASETLSQRRIDFEAFFNHFSPFYYAAVLYVAAFILGALAWLGWTEPLRRSSMWLLGFTLIVHTFALVGRIYISGRPPVTNLYSSAVFIGWACVVLGLMFEGIYRLGLGNIVAAVSGFLTLLVAHFLSLDGDTFIVLQAVLDTQFWLATHVVCITLGYSTTFLAGMLGILYVLLAHVLPVLGGDDRRNLVRMIYGTLCFAIFFSFIGTVLGGLWADDSWGRFWGWDPKENGALIIVLYNALVLHARWGGLVKGRGLAVLAIGGNIVTTWSWFGVNELGVGLHAYGASERNTAMWLLVFVASQATLMALGAVPQRWWRFGGTAKRASSS